MLFCTTTSRENARSKPAATATTFALCVLAGTLLGIVPRATGQDPENCLSCHRFRGLSRLDPETNELRLFFCSAEYYAHRQGAHARLRCTDCHEKAEVRVIPHEVKTPVDCTQTCHITPAATGATLEFSHQRVEDSLAHSVHAPEKLDELHFDPPLLRPGQSDCLYCHDQPVFGHRHGVPEGFRDHSGGTRCDTCHSEVLPLEVTYFANHVAARMKPARPVRQLAQVCAVCHSHEQLVERYEGHDPIASYLHSFHGKASLLGSEDTATCVECHSHEAGDQHLMLGSEVAESPVTPINLPDTCRTTQCHPGAPPELSSAAVHLELDPAKHTPEFYVAAFFILMTASVMAVFFLLVILELLNAVFRRQDAEHHRMVALARILQSHPEARYLLQRMKIHERIQHWGLAISFGVLVLTGMPIKFAEAEWSSMLVTLMGGLTVVRFLHRLAGVVIIVVFLYHVGYLVFEFFRRRLQVRREGIREPIWLTMYNFPMMMRPEDAVEFFQLFAHLLGFRKKRPHFGRYNVLEKFEYWAVFWGMPVMGFSGLALWGMPVISEHLSGRAINFAFIIHSDEAYLAFIYIAAIHLFSVIFAPTVFPLSLGTLSGHAPTQELVEGHRGELEAIARRVGATLPDIDHPGEYHRGDWKHMVTDTFRRVYSIVAAAAYAAVAFISLRFLLLMLLTRQTAPVEITDIPTRLDANEFLRGRVQTVSHDPEHRSRGPLAHFHQIPQWFTPDPLDSCATSGCHAPLPHGKRIEVRAFLNMHATFVDCAVCHAAAQATPENARWISLPERQPTETPAILRLDALLEENPEISREQAPEFSPQIRALLVEAVAASGHHPQIEDWLLRLDLTHPRSRVWQQLINEIRLNIDLHVHGEYGAKIAMYNGPRRVGAMTTEQRQAAAAYRDGGDDLSPTRKEELLDVVHASIRPVGAMCTPCHAQEPELVDMSLLGYSAGRVRALQNSPILRSVLTIEAGQPFYLPLDQEGETE